MAEYSAITPGEILQQLRISCKFPEIVQAVQARKIVARAAEAARIIVKPEELQQAADKFRLTNNLSSAKETLAWLQKFGLSTEDFEALIQHTVLTSKLANHLFQDKVESHFTIRQLDYTQVFLYEVTLSSQDLAAELFYAIQEHEMTFTEMARQYAQDPEQRRRCGYCGLLARSELKPEISVAVFAATPPQVIRPVLIGKQVHLIWVEEIIVPTLSKELRQQISWDLFSEWLRQQVGIQDFSSKALPS